MQVVISDEGAAQTVSFEPEEEEGVGLAIVAPARSIVVDLEGQVIRPAEVHQDDDCLDVLFELASPGRHLVLYDSQPAWWVDLDPDGNVEVCRHGSTTCFRSPISWIVHPEERVVAPASCPESDAEPMTERGPSWWQRLQRGGH